MTDSHDGFRDLSAIGDVFKSSIAHMKGGFPAWEEFLARGMKFQKHFEQTIIAFNGFTDSLYKISEVAHNTKGGTYEIGNGLINLAMWHRGQEMKLKEMNQALMTKLLGPLQVKIEEWKRTTAALEREHDKELQKSIKDIKEAAKNAMKTGKSLESKLKKDKTSDKTSTLHQQLEHYHHETDRYLKETEERERKNLNRVLLEERSWFCGFVTAYTRVLDVEAGMLMDLERLQAILKDLSNEVSQPAILPGTTREMLESWTIPASPASLHKKMTSAPSMISVSSGSSGDSGGPVISGPVISGPVMTGSTLGSAVGSIPIHHPPSAPPTGGGSCPPPPPPPAAPPFRKNSGGNTNLPPPPPVQPPPTSVSSVTAPPPSGPKPPPPTTQPPPSHRPQHTSHPHPQPFSQTLPRSLNSNRSASVDRGKMLNRNASLLQGLDINPGGVHGVPFTANDHIQNRSLPPVPPGEEPFRYPDNSGTSISPRTSLASNQSELSHSLSPLEIRSLGMPPIAETNFNAAEEHENQSFQEQLLNRIRVRSNSVDAQSAHGVQGQENVYSLPSFNTPPLAKAHTMYAKQAPPPVSSKPSRAPSVASKPNRSGPANGHGPPMTQSLDSRHAPPLQHSTALDLDLEPEEDNMFARALREKKLRSVQTNDRSNPLVGR